MPIEIKEVVIKARVAESVDTLHARLKRLEQVILMSGDPSLAGDPVNVVIRASGSVSIEAGREATVSGRDKASIQSGPSKVEVCPGKVSISTAGSLTVDASSSTVNISMINVNSAMTKFSGVVKASTMITNTIVASTYTPGAGNVW